jgi:hypothetical protein
MIELVYILRTVIEEVCGSEGGEGLRREFRQIEECARRYAADNIERSGGLVQPV